MMETKTDQDWMILQLRTKSYPKIKAYSRTTYWLGDPDVGYGDDWNEPMSVPVGVGQTDSDYSYVSGTTTQRETIL